MQKWDFLKLHQLLSQYPRMRLEELGEGQVVIKGEYYLNAQMEGFEKIQQTYKIIISFPEGYPKVLPIVKEVSNIIPRVSDYHTYDDGSFCLGSEIKLKSILFEQTTAMNFVDKVLNPFLYAVSYKLKYNIYPFGDLDHGEDGLIDDYQRLFNVDSKAAVLKVLSALGRRKRDANKLACPCGCEKRLGRCDFRFSLQKWRGLGRRRWFREHLRTSFTPIEIPKKKTRSR